MSRVNASRKHSRRKSVARWFKYQALKLLRAKEGPAVAAMGFSIGLAVEMFTLPTVGLAFFLIFPLAYWLRGSVAAALIGFGMGKIIYVPMSFLNQQVGNLLLPLSLKEWLFLHLPSWLVVFLKLNLSLLIGGIVVGAALGLMAYFPVRWSIRRGERRRKEQRKLKKRMPIQNY